MLTSSVTTRQDRSATTEVTKIQKEIYDTYLMKLVAGVYLGSSEWCSDWRRVEQRVAQRVEQRLAQRVEQRVAQRLAQRLAQRVEQRVAQRVEQRVAQLSCEAKFRGVGKMGGKINI